jgi:hypothetical protein
MYSDNMVLLVPGAFCTVKRATFLTASIVTGIVKDSATWTWISNSKTTQWSNRGEPAIVICSMPTLKDCEQHLLYVLQPYGLGWDTTGQYVHSHE